MIRDGMIIALLAACPIRARNFAHLELGRTIRYENSAWWIVLDANETKNGRADQRCLPDYLPPLLEFYLLYARPVLIAAKTDVVSALPELGFDQLSGPLWLSYFGRPLDEQGLHIITTRETRKALGVPVNPHAFRSAAATTAAWDGSATPHIASAILQHSDSRITDAHYNRGRSYEAAIALQKMLRGREEKESPPD